LLNFAIRDESCAAPVGVAVREKRYSQPAIGIVLSGSFEYRDKSGSATAVPGALVFGNPEETFRCRHLERGGNCRQVAKFATHFVQGVAADMGLDEPAFRAAVVPPGGLAAQAFGMMQRLARQSYAGEEAAYELAGLALQVNRTKVIPTQVSTRNQRRILAVVAHLESQFSRPWTLQELAALIPLSAYHFLRLFKAVVGQSPSQYILYARLRAAASRLLTSRAPVFEVALQSGFNDISHFNACFRRQFGQSPMRWRA
jgi:AraC family transcriptional regulator